MRPGCRRWYTRTGDAANRHIARCTGNRYRRSLLDRAGLAADRLRLREIGGCVVHRRDGDRHGHFRAGAQLVGCGSDGDALIVDRHQLEGVGETFAAVVSVLKFSRRKLRRADHRAAGGHQHAAQRQVAVRDIAGDAEAEEVIDRMAGFRKQV